MTVSGNTCTNHTLFISFWATHTLSLLCTSAKVALFMACCLLIRSACHICNTLAMCVVSSKQATDRRCVA